MSNVAECQSFSDFQSLREAVEVALCGPVSIISSKTVEQANREIKDGENKFPSHLQFKNVRLGCKQFGYRADGKNTRVTHSPVKIQCPAHVIAVADQELGVLVIKQVSFEHNHPVLPPTSTEKRRLLPALPDDDHPVSHVGLTITVSCKDQSSDNGGDVLVNETNEEKQDLLSDVTQSEEDEEEDIDGDEGDDSEEDDDESDDEEEEVNSARSASGRRKNAHKISKARKYGRYSTEALAAAWRAISKDGLSVHMAARIYKIPKSTLYDRVNNKNMFNLGCKPNANKTKILDQDTERQMVEHIRLLQSSGYHVTKNEMLSLATKLSRLTGRLGKKTNLTRGWLPSFMERWPDLLNDKNHGDFRKPTDAFPHNVVAYYDKLKFIMNLHNGAFHKKPHLIFTVEEIVFLSDLKSVIPQVPDVKRRSELTSNDTVLASLLICGSAAGHVIPPYFIVKDRKPRDNVIERSGMNISTTGLVNSPLIKEFFGEYLLENLCIGLADYILVIHDLPGSVVSPEVLGWAKEEKFILHPCPPQTRFSSQPLEFAHIDSFKHCFENHCSQYLKEHYQLHHEILFHLACTAVQKSVSNKTLQQMFEKGGIFPYNTSELTKEHLLPYTFQTQASEIENIAKGPCRKRRKVIKTGVTESTEAKIDMEELCCFCEQAEPPLHSGFSANSTTILWGQCSKCSHWVHLKFCSPVKAVNARSVFLCSHCTGL